MKIAIAMENLNRHAGGAESYAVELAERLVAEGWEVHLYGYKWAGEPREAIFHEISQPGKWVPPSLRILYFALKHKKMVCAENFDVILGFGNTLTMNVYQTHGGVHYISNIRKLQAVENPILRLIKMMAMFLTPKYHARAWIEAAAFRMEQLPVIVAISEMVRQDISHYFHIDDKKIRLVYNGINPERFKRRSDQDRNEIRKNLGFDDEILFLFMAYDFRKKGVKQLIRAASILSDRVGPKKFGIVIVGNSPSSSLRHLVTNLRLNDTVLFQGPTKRPEMYYHSCDVFVLPTFYDACSLVVFEAMSAGLPAITTVCNGASGIITHGVDGIILDDPRNVNELALAMERFLNSEILRASSAAAQETARKYTVQTNHEKMIKIFNEISRRSIS